MSSFDHNPFQRLSAGSTLGRAFALFVKRYDLFLLIGAILCIPIVLMMTTMFKLIGSSAAAAAAAMNQAQGGGYSDVNTDNSNLASTSAGQFPLPVVANMGGFIGQFLAEYVFLVIVSIAGKAAMCFAVAQLYIKEEPRWLNSLKQGFSRWCDLFGTGLLVALGLAVCHLFTFGVFYAILQLSTKLVPLVFILQICYIVFLIFVSVSLMIMVPVIIVEQKGPVDTIKRCWELANGQRCFIFCTVFCLAIISWILQILLAKLFIAVHPDGPAAPATHSFLYSLLSVLPSLVFMPLMTITETVVYFNIRVEREGLNHETLEGELGGVATATKVSTFDPDQKYNDGPSGGYSDNVAAAAVV